MFHKVETEKHIWNWRWPLIAVIVLLFFVVIQILRVNDSPLQNASEPEAYASLGPLTTGNLIIPARDFYSNRINLNRRAKLSGEFRTGGVKLRVSVLVLNETNYDNWARGLSYDSEAQTGYVPVGKVGPMLEPGTYFLIIDNRLNDSSQSVLADFVLE